MGQNSLSSAELEIIFDDTSSSLKFNKELINYFKNNLDTLNRSGIKFMWRIATKEEYPLYKERGIKHYPAIIIPPKITKYGVKDIIKEISAYNNRRKEMLGPTSSLTNGMAEVSDEALYEYQRRAIGKAGDDDADPRDGFDLSYRRRQSDMLRRRQAAGMECPMDEGNRSRDVGANLDIGMGGDDMGLGDDPYKVNISGDRPDNLNPMRIDPSDSLDRLRRTGNTDSQDIELMQMQLNKMQMGDMGGIDYY